MAAKAAANPLLWVSVLFEKYGTAAATAASQADLTTATAQAPPKIRRINFSDLQECLADGWDDFLESRVHYVMLGLIYPVVGLLIARLSMGDAGDAYHLVYPLAAGFTLLGPFAAVGLEEISRRREHGMTVRWLDAFAVMGSPRLPAIVFFGALLCAVYLLWLGAAHGLYLLTIGPMIQAASTTPTGMPVPISAGHFLHTALTTGAGWTMLVGGTAIGFIFAVAVLFIGVISFPMLLDRSDLGATAGAQVSTAMRTSVQAVLANPVPMFAWGAIVAVLLLVGSLPLLVGLVVVMPVLGHATWHLYRKVIA
jgi:uncharacterized membrane protein